MDAFDFMEKSGAAVKTGGNVNIGANVQDRAIVAESRADVRSEEFKAAVWDSVAAVRLVASTSWADGIKGGTVNGGKAIAAGTGGMVCNSKGAIVHD